MSHIRKKEQANNSWGNGKEEHHSFLNKNSFIHDNTNRTKHSVQCEGEHWHEPTDILAPQSESLLSSEWNEQHMKSSALCTTSKLYYTASHKPVTFSKSMIHNTTIKITAILKRKVPSFILFF